MDNKRVKIIDPKINLNINDGYKELKQVKRKTCAYARVSTDDTDQKTSYEAQIDEYTKKIKKNPNYEFIGVFADEGISGTSLKHRDEFNRMIELAKFGEIDLIITKSISRFARNTELTLKTVRELKDSNVEVFFEKENLWTFDPKVELFLTIFSSIAQEEVRNTSENVTWNVRKRMREGVPIINHNRFLGYTKDEFTKNLVIVPEEAKIVKLIFDMYTSYINPGEICRTLEKNGYLTGAGKTKWYPSTIKGILENEKYVGDLLLQKTYTVDYLTHKRIDNIDKLPKYFIENSHEAIIDRKTFELAKKIRAERANQRIGSNTDAAKYRAKYPLSHMIICLNCGKTLKRHHWNYGLPSQCIVRLCGNYLNGRDNCNAKGIKEELIEAACIEVINKIILSKNKIVNMIKKNISKDVESTLLESKVHELNLEKEKLENDLSRIIDMRLEKNTNDSSVLNKKYSEVCKQLDVINREIKKLKSEDLKYFKNYQRIEKIDELIKNNKEGIKELDIVTLHTFINKIISVSHNEIIICVPGIADVNHEYFVENRFDIVKLQESFSGYINLPRFRETLFYKVISV